MNLLVVSLVSWQPNTTKTYSNPVTMILTTHVLQIIQLLLILINFILSVTR